jgi:deoxycytidylate deaminase
MTMAAAVATNSSEPNRHGAVIVRKGMPISSGWNKNKTHPAAVVYYSGNIHAELAAIIGVNKQDLAGTDIYVARRMRSQGEPLGMSKPCKECRKMIRQANIKRIYYTDRQGEWKMERA